MATAQKPMEFTVWCLFSIENNYDQPEHNVHTIWAHKPSMEQLGKVLNRAWPGHTDEQTLFIVNLWRGERVMERPGDTLYRLREVELGERLEDQENVNA